MEEINKVNEIKEIEESATEVEIKPKKKGQSRERMLELVKMRSETAKKKKARER